MLIGDARTEPGATWHLTKPLDVEKKDLDKNLSCSLCSATAGLSHWGARLHVLQGAPRIGIWNDTGRF
ncbi:MAG: hypothetical protein ACTS3R_17435 [Inquilinaceae bacterium]